MVTSLRRDTRIRIPKKIGTGSGTLPTQKSGYATGLRYIPEKYRHKKRGHQMVTSLRRDTRIRTWDPLLPKQVRYRAALHPEKLH
jgi:hypothetical protein